MQSVIVDNRIYHFDEDGILEFVTWVTTKGGRRIPIFGRGEKSFTKKQIGAFKKRQVKKKAEIKKKRAVSFNAANDKEGGFTESEAEAWAEKNGTSKEVDKLTDEQVDIVNDYTLDSFIEINKDLRTDNDESEKGREIEVMTEAIAGTSIPADIILSRGMMFETDADATDFIDSMKPGTVFQDKAFMSTTVGSANDFGSVIFKIDAPKGTKGIETFSSKSKLKGPFSSELEFLLQRGTSLQVKSTSKAGDITTISAKIVSQVPTKLNIITTFKQSTRSKKARIERYLWETTDIQLKKK